jgi:hypothetical protein
MPFIPGHSQTTGRPANEKMAEAFAQVCGADLKSHYRAHGPKLSNHFRAV